MELEGRIFRDGKFWLIEVPSLDLMTQGKTKKEAVEMIEDAVLGLIECYFKPEIGKKLKISVNEYKKDTIGILASDNKVLLALSLKRQREKSGITVREAAKRLGATSPTAYAQYERGTIRMSLEKYDQLLKAVNPFIHSLLRIV